MTPLKITDYPLTASRFVELCREAVMYYPESGNDLCKTFVVIDTKADFEKTNIGYDYQDARSRYFFTRNLESVSSTNFDFQYPLVAIADVGGKDYNIIRDGNKTSSTVTQFKIYVLDTYSDDAQTRDLRKMRRIPEIQDACKLIIRRLFDYLNKVQFYKVDSVYGYYNADYLAYAKTNAIITDYWDETQENELSQINNHFRQTMIDLNKEQIQAPLMPFTSSKITGRSTYLGIIEHYCDNSIFQFDHSVKPLVHGTCCV